MSILPQGVVEVLTLDPEEFLLDGWSAYHKIEGENFLDVFAGTSWDYEGYLVLTSARLIFVKKEGTLRITYEVVPFLVERLENISVVRVDKRELVISGERFKISGANPEAVMETIKTAVGNRYQGEEPESDSEPRE
jgi:hypothetical protein